MDLAVQTDEEIQLVPGPTWWWVGWSLLSFFALLLNIIFIVVAIKQRKNKELRSLLTATLITLAVLDILDVIRIASSVFVNTHQFNEYRVTFCSVGVAHTVGVSLLLIMATLYLIFPCRDAPPLYYPASTCSGSIPQKVLIPLVLLVSGGVGALVYLLPDFTKSITDSQNLVPHSCLDYTRARYVANENNPKFWADLYQTLILTLAVIIPLLLTPPTILVASVRSCVKGQCCHSKYRQNAGEILCVLFVLFLYLGTVVAVVLPRLNDELDLGVEQLQSAPTLWELANAVGRPLIYVLCNPGVWDGVVHLCSCRKNMSRGNSLAEEEMALSPVVERVSSL